MILLGLSIMAHLVYKLVNSPPRLEEVGSEKVDPADDPDSWYERGCISTLGIPSRSFNKGIRCYTEAIKLDPMDERWWRYLGLCLKQTSQYDKALIALNQAITLDPESETAYSIRSLVHYKLGNKAEERADLDKAIELGKRSKAKSKP